MGGVRRDGLVVGDLAENPSKLGLRIDVVEFGGFDRHEGDHYSLAAAF